MENPWDERYARPEYIYGVEPNAFFKQELDKLSAGKIFLPAEGEGRNAVYAAKAGWQVYAMDFSEMGQRKALKLAKELNVEIHYEVSNLEKSDFQADTYDAIAIIYAHFSSKIRVNVYQKLAESLKPGGTLILETFNKKQLGNSSGGPQDIDMLNSIDDLKQDFKKLEIIEINECQTDLSEGNYHKGKADVIRLLARKPFNP